MPEGGPIQFGTDGWRALIAEDFTDENLKRVARGIGANHRCASAARNEAFQRPQEGFETLL